MFYRNFGKRTLDVTTAIVGLIVFAPVLLMTAVVVRIQMGSPMLFRQERPGLGGKLFTIYKFRTMRDAVDAEGAPLPDELRLTPFGTFLRSSSIDELPELWNVVRGDMSLVGPRPLLPQYLDRYTARQARRHDVRPGITGWAQVNGRNAIGWTEKFQADVWYVENVSLPLDAKILLMTVRQLFSRDGINAPGHATAREFLGKTDS